jgi:hypothetical protein
MESLFQSTAADKMLARLEKLQPGAQPMWGKMKVSQMLAHCEVPLEVALGKKQLKRTFMGVIFGKIGKRQVLKPEPFKKNLPTDPNFIVKHNPDFSTEKQKLATLIKEFSAADPIQVASKPHPFFGNMTAEEWGWLQYKHLDHHLQQFGV